MQRPSMLVGLALTVGALGMLGAADRTGVHAQQPPDVRTVIESYKAALTKLDAPAVTALFDDNIVLDNFGDTAKGKAEAETLLRDAIAANPHLAVTLSDTVYVLNTAIEREAFSSDAVRAAGVSRVWGIETIVVLGGKIVSYTAVPDLDDPETARFVQIASQQ